MSLRKHGNTVEFWVEGRKALSYTDSQPIAGGIPAIWTTDNGIALARATIRYATPPQPAELPRVVLETPDYPEWVNLGHPLTLDLGQTWSTTGKPVTLKAAPKSGRDVPKGDEDAVTVNGLRTTFAPKHLGNHWYQLTATDGATTSPAFHLTAPVFNPALGRDDAHTLILYRFDEGDGATIHDRAAIKPALDIAIPQDAPVQWQPIQGLTLRGVTKLTTAPALKLAAIADKGTCTMEAWVSTDTLYPPSGWTGSLMSWEATFNQPNLAFMHRSQSNTFNTRGASGELRQAIWGGYRTGLQHYVATWDGKVITGYINGALVYSAAFPITPALWAKDAPLWIGSVNNGQFNFLGTLYLLAIHDTCLTADQVKRHYQAGPSGR